MPDDLLVQMFDAMLGRLGPQGWWPSSPALTPHDRKLEICAGAILTQNTAWRNVERALERLIHAGAMSTPALAELEPADLAELIRPAGYFNVKARRLKAFVAHVMRRHDGDVRALLARPADELRDELLALHGIGPETADSILLYAAGKPRFVVDAYTRRIGVRHELFEPGASYDEIQQLYEARVPPRAVLYNEYHALIVHVGKQWCRPLARCDGCPLDCFHHDPTRKA